MKEKKLEYLEGKCKAVLFFKSPLQLNHQKTQQKNGIF